MAFIGILIMLLMLGVLLFGVIGVAASLILTLVYRKKRRRWMKITAIVLAVCAAVSLLVSGGFLLWATSF